jgi:hypothetical protein
MSKKPGPPLSAGMLLRDKRFLDKGARPFWVMDFGKLVNIDKMLEVAQE